MTLRVLLFAALAAAVVAYSYWVYLRVELRVPAGRWLALVRASVLVVILLLLFNPRLPLAGGAGAPLRWVLLDASLSMTATDEGGATAWEAATARAAELGADGWNVVRFGDESLDRATGLGAGPDRLESRLAPALGAAAEAGAREVRVLSDARLEDPVAVRSAREALPLALTLERFGGPIRNVGIARFRVPDVARADEALVAELDVFAEEVGDSVAVEILEEGRPVASVVVPSPTPGMRVTTRIELPASAETGRVRYTARVDAEDGFADDDEAVAYANVGFEAGGVVLVSLRPDWEPRFLLPVLAEVTGLSATGYLRAGDDRFLPLGRAADRGGPVDSATVGQAAREATILVVHGLDGRAPAWLGDLAAGDGRRLLMPLGPEGASVAGVDVRAVRSGEWYVFPDVPTSPIAGALTGVSLEGLPPVTDVLVPETPIPSPPLQLQLRGAGAPESAFALVARPQGRVVVALASGFWRWAMRESGRDAYRSLWSGVAGWLLADRGMASAEPQPVRWIVPRGEPVTWNMPTDPIDVRIRVETGDSLVVDTVTTGGATVSTGRLPPASYRYAVLRADGDTLGAGRFDVASSTLEMLPRPSEPEPATADESGTAGDAPPGSPLRTTPWPYLLVITLLCAEWIVRRRSGLR